MNKLKKNIFNIILVLLIFVLFIRVSSFFSDRYISSLSFLALCVLIILLTFKFIQNKTIVFVVSSLCAVIILTELTLTFISPYRSYTEKNGGYSFQSPFYQIGFSVLEKPNIPKSEKNSEFAYSYKTNNLGLRDNPVLSEQIRVFLMGDSFIQGVGVGDKDRIDIHLEKLVRCKECFLNVGAPGSDLFYSYDGMDSLFKLGLLPELVILNINSSDIVDIITRHLVDTPTSLAFDFFYGSSFIFRHVSHTLYDLDFLFLNTRDRENYEKLALKKIEQKLLEYKAFLYDNNISFIVFLQPIESELKNEDYILSTLVDFAKQEEILLFDTRKELNKISKNKDLYWPIDGHFNENGTEEFANIIYNNILLSFPNLVNSIKTNNE